MKRTISLALTIVLILSSCNKSPDEEHLFDNKHHFDMLYMILQSEGGSYNPNEQICHFADAYCDSCCIRISNDGWWNNSDLCYDWFGCCLGKEKREIFGVTGVDIVCYLNGSENQMLEDILPDRITCKQQIKQYCQDVWFPERNAETLYMDGFDPWCFIHSFDGLNAYDWLMRNWQKYIDVKVLDIKKNKETNSAIAYNVTFKYVFAVSKYGDKAHDDVEFVTTLTEYSDGRYNFSLPFDIR